MPEKLHLNGYYCKFSLNAKIRKKINAKKFVEFFLFDAKQQELLSLTISRCCGYLKLLEAKKLRGVRIF